MCPLQRDHMLFNTASAERYHKDDTFDDHLHTEFRVLAVVRRVLGIMRICNPHARMVCRLCALVHKLGLLRMTEVVIGSLAGSGSSLSRDPSDNHRARRAHNLHTGESQPKLKLPGYCSFCSRMTLEHQILIKRGIKHASFHHACHRTDPRISQKSFPNAPGPLFTTVW